MESSSKSSEVCLYCCKAGHNTANLKNENFIASKFVDCLLKFSGQATLKGDKNNDLCTLNRPKLLGCCESCLEIIEGFCAEFHELKCLELRLEWNLQKLKSIMKLAGRVPSRMLKLQQLFHQPHEPTSSENENGGDSLKKFYNYRRKIIKTCDKRLSKSQPKIYLKRIGHQDSFNSDQHFLENEVERDSYDTAEPDPLSNNEFDKSNKVEICEPQVTQGDLPHDQVENSVNPEKSEMNIECKICSKMFANNTFMYHMTKVHKLHPCWECGKEYRKGLSPRSWKCTSCTRKLGQACEQGNPNNIARGNNIISVRRYQCPVCKKSFKTSGALTNHKAMHRNPETWKYKCDKCSKSFFKEVILQTHIKLCHSETYILAEDNTAADLLPEQVGEMSIKCKKCFRTFIDETKLNAHIGACRRIHHCPACSQSFMTMYRRDKHIISAHTNKLKNPKGEFFTRLKIFNEKLAQGKRRIKGKRLPRLHIRELFKRNVEHVHTVGGKEAQMDGVRTERSDSVPDSVFTDNNDNDTEIDGTSPQQTLAKSIVTGSQMKKIKLEDRIIFEFEGDEAGISSEDMIDNGGTQTQESEAKLDLSSFTQNQINTLTTEPVDKEIIVDDDIAHSFTGEENVNVLDNLEDSKISSSGQSYQYSLREKKRISYKQMDDDNDHESDVNEDDYDNVSVEWDGDDDEQSSSSDEDIHEGEPRLWNQERLIENETTSNPTNTTDS